MKLRELIELLRKSESVEELDARRSEIRELIPKVEIMFEFDQQNSAHQYDLWMHTLHAVVNLPKDIPDDMVYLAALLHDIGKPDSQISGKDPDDPYKHYYGHPHRSMEIVRDEIIPLLLQKGECLTADEQRRLIYYVEWHDDPMSLRMKHLRQHLNLGASFEEFRNLMKLQLADANAHIMIPIVCERVEVCSKLAGEYGEELYRQILDGK